MAAKSSGATAPTEYEHRLIVRTEAAPSAALLEELTRGGDQPVLVTNLVLVSAPIDAVPPGLHMLEASLASSDDHAAAARLVARHADVLDAAVVRTRVVLPADDSRAPTVMRAHFMHRTPSSSRASFAERYEAHAALVVDHGPLFEAYVTNTAILGEASWDGLSQQWFPDHATAVEHTRVTLEEKPVVACDIAAFIGSVESYEAASRAWVGRRADQRGDTAPPATASNVAEGRTAGTET